MKAKTGKTLSELVDVVATPRLNGEAATTRRTVLLSLPATMVRRLRIAAAYAELSQSAVVEALVENFLTAYQRGDTTPCGVAVKAPLTIWPRATPAATPGGVRRL